MQMDREQRKKKQEEKKEDIEEKKGKKEVKTCSPKTRRKHDEDLEATERETEGREVCVEAFDQQAVYTQEHAHTHIGNLGTFEVCGCGCVSDMDPADSLLVVEEVHGCGLFGAGGQQAVHRGAAQGGGLDVLGVGDQQDRQTVYWHWKKQNSKQLGHSTERGEDETQRQQSLIIPLCQSDPAPQGTKNSIVGVTQQGKAAALDNRDVDGGWPTDEDGEQVTVNAKRSRGLSQPGVAQGLLGCMDSPATKASGLNGTSS
ncbi:hypothetical protein EYF80_008388 [Liparis tanakae]|uniref:Uncharacterized protein n=1 Tax=Liparis tanakae TaxID=230148 RepID=A0A4Z2IVN8_9TELE|nr:hypothetical protein EYF80_008388 [Liparis tanakae]